MAYRVAKLAVTLEEQNPDMFQTMMQWMPYIFGIMMIAIVLKAVSDVI